MTKALKAHDANAQPLDELVELAADVRAAAQHVLLAAVAAEQVVSHVRMAARLFSRAAGRRRR